MPAKKPIPLTDPVAIQYRERSKATKCRFCREYYNWRSLDAEQSHGLYITKKEYKIVLKRCETRPCEYEPCVTIPNPLYFKVNYCPECGDKLSKPKNDSYYKQERMKDMNTFRKRMDAKPRKHYNYKDPINKTGVKQMVERRKQKNALKNSENML